jgi:hypothetical protein
MTSTFYVSGLSCLVEGTQAIIYLPARKSYLTKDEAAVVIQLHMKAKRVHRYLIEEGFVPRGTPLKLATIHNSKPYG